MLFNILAFISIIILITVLRLLVNIFPSLVGCLFRSKESLNLEASAKQSHERNILALTMIIPFCLSVEKFGLYDPSFMEPMNENFRILTIFGVFMAYIAIRVMASMITATFAGKKTLYTAADKSVYTFFIILTLIISATGGILTFTHVEPDVIKSAMLWISAGTYAIFLLRKFQIFFSGFSILTSFLYLCALEIIPTGLLVVSVLLF